MKKKDYHKQTLTELFEEFLRLGNEASIREYLVSNSSLPGPRGNLELAGAFAETAEAYAKEAPQRVWGLCLAFSQVSADRAPTDDPKESVAFCGTRGLGAVGASVPSYFDEALANLFELAHDPRWRVREAVAMAIQRLVEAASDRVLRALEGWIQDEDWLAMRAVAAGLAEPGLLKGVSVAKKALVLHEDVVAYIATSSDRRSGAFKALKKGLGYTFSVVTLALPEKGFAVLQGLAALDDKDLRWIVNANLKKNRLVKRFPDEVAQCRKLLDQKPPSKA